MWNLALDETEKKPSQGFPTTWWTLVEQAVGDGTTMRMAAHVLVLLPDGAFEGTTEALRASRNPRIMSFLQEDIDEAMALAEVEVAPK